MCYIICNFENKIISIGMLVCIISLGYFGEHYTLGALFDKGKGIVFHHLSIVPHVDQFVYQIFSSKILTSRA